MQMIPETKTTYEVVDGIMWLIYHDDTNLEKAAPMCRTLPELLEGLELQGVILDVSGIDMLNSSGIGVLMQIAKAVLLQNLTFVVIINDYLTRILHMVGLESVINTAETREEALALFRELVA